jgi:hypothetical protein
MSTILDKILKRIRAKKKGWVFTPKDFLDMSPRSAVDNILSRLAKRGIIRRIDKGIYDFPKCDKNIGTLSPSADAVAQALARKSGNDIFPSGAGAANLLGLSTQVQSRSIYLTNGPSRSKKIGTRTITLKHAKVPLLDNISFEANLALQAISYIGKNQFDNDMMKHCSQKLSKKDILSLNKAAHLVPAWMNDTIYKLQSRLNG